MKKFNCPFCDEVSTELKDIHEHIDEDHETNIPKDTSIAHFYYAWRTGRDHGNCVECKRETVFNETTGKYNRFCGRVACKNAYVDRVRKRMVGKYGKTTLLNDPEHQKKMLKNRSISGSYTWSDRRSKTDYTGSYELDFLKFLDLFLEFDPKDVIMPSPHTYWYEYDGKKHFYIPDAYIPSLNVEFEIKDGGDNPNMHHKIQDVDKVKEKLKDEVMTSQRERSYVKVLNKEYDTVIQFLLEKKEEFTLAGETVKPIFILSKNDVETGMSKEEFIAMESTSCMALSTEYQTDEIVKLSSMIDDCTNNIGIDWKEYTNNPDLHFRAYKTMKNILGDETLHINAHDCDTEYDQYGMFVDDIHTIFNDFLSDVSDSPPVYAKKQYDRIEAFLKHSTLNLIDDTGTVKPLTYIIKRDILKSLLISQTIINRNNENVLNPDILKDYMALCLNHIIPTIDHKLEQGGQPARKLPLRIISLESLMESSLSVDDNTNPVMENGDSTHSFHSTI